MNKKKDSVTLSQLACDYMYLRYKVLPRRLKLLKEFEKDPGIPKLIVTEQKKLVSRVKKDIKKKMQDYINHTLN